jgi:hypothetical protein
MGVQSHQGLRNIYLFLSLDVKKPIMIARKITKNNVVD